MNKVLILGAAGFTGAHLLRYIEHNSLTHQFDFVLADRSPGKDCGSNFIETDLSEQGNVDRLVEMTRPDFVISLIGTHTETDYDRLLRVNAGIARELCDSIVRRKLPLKKLLLIGSAAEYGQAEQLPITETSPARPVNPYGLTKLVQTLYGLYYYENFGLPVAVARTFNIIGRGLPRTLSIGNFAHQINAAADGGTVQTGNLDTRRDFLDIADVIDAYWRILTFGKPGEIYNVCRGASILQKDVVDYLIRTSRKRLHTETRTAFVKSKDIADSYGDNGKLMRDTGWTCRVDIFDSLRALLDVQP